MKTTMETILTQSMLHFFQLHYATRKKIKPVYEPSGPSGLHLSLGFCSIEWLGVFLLPPGYDASLSQGYPQR